VTFALERFEWTPGALELSGRWDRPRRFRHVRLVVGGHRIAPLSQSHDDAWSAVFPWAGDEPPADPCLEVGHDLLVELPAPDRVLVAASAAPLADPLAVEREALAADQESLRKEQEALAADRSALEADRAALAADREALVADQESLRKEQEALGADRSALEADRAALAADRAGVASPTNGAAPAPAPAPAAAVAAPAAAAVRGAAAPATAAAQRRPWDPSAPRHVAIQHALELPRQPDEPVHGQAPPAIRAIAVALCSGVVVALLIILSAIF
jgi:hypothetical protein